MTGHLKQRGKNGVWYAVFRVNGKQKWHRLQATGKRQAEKEMTTLLAGLHSGDYVETSRMTVEQYLKEKWIPLVVGTEWAPSTLAKFEGNVRNYVSPTIGSLPLQKLTGLHIQEMYAAMMDGKLGKALKSQTVRVLHVNLHKAFDQAVTWGLMNRNPAEGAGVKRGKAKKKKVLTGDETVQLLDHFRDTDIYIPVMIIICTGMRRGEVLGLRWSDVKLETGQLYVEQALTRVKGETHLGGPKTDGSERFIKMPTVLVEDLRQHRQAQKVRSLAQDLICTRDDGSPMVPTTFSDKFARYAAAAGFKGVTPHAMRHGHASILDEDGIRDKVISERLGHKGIAITKDTYTHLFQSAQDDAANTVDKILKRKRGAR